MDTFPIEHIRAETDDAIRALLSFGEPNRGDWINYPTRFALGGEHIGELIRLACDEGLNMADAEEPGLWAPIHAWRALGQLRAEAAVEPLLALMASLYEDEAVIDDIPVVLGMIGPSAIEPIERLIFAPDMADAACSAVVGLREMGQRHADCRAACVASLTRLLGPRPEPDVLLNGVAVSALIDLGAVEAIDDIRAAFRRGEVDISVAGDEEDVEISLGLREHRDTPKPRYLVFPDFDPPASDIDDWAEPNIPVRSEKIGRNAPCPCGSGKKYKKCCLP